MVAFFADRKGYCQDQENWDSVLSFVQGSRELAQPMT